MCVRNISTIRMFLAVLYVCIMGIFTVQKGMEIIVSQSQEKFSEPQVKETFFSIAREQKKVIKQLCCPGCATRANVTQELYTKAWREQSMQWSVTPQGSFTYNEKKAENDSELREFIVQSSESQPIMFDPEPRGITYVVARLMLDQSKRATCTVYCRDSSTSADILRAVSEQTQDPSYISASVAYCGKILPLDKPLGVVFADQYWEQQVLLVPSETVQQAVTIQKQPSSCVTMRFNMIDYKGGINALKSLIEHSCCSKCATLTGIMKGLYETAWKNNHIYLPITPQGCFFFREKKAKSDYDLRNFIIQSNGSGEPIIFDPKLQHTTMVSVLDSLGKKTDLCLGMHTTPTNIIRAFNSSLGLPSTEVVTQNVICNAQKLPDTPLGEDGIRRLSSVGGACLYIENQDT
jgi:hypothetical protein